ncbi:hypothetical protein [Streptomyces resistomycificus]|uniref:Uncharacterized protein n=1 Tax=Streptomyces resistomycificus TaxID=67356 RepID=A0A0L8L3J4_9ACTN|nr:hypothetical protein [Streptomyces resistomycificus]KOG32808.1 hypothetical protein ADK37_25570 [Streptomyces resistomycificus]KUN90683.1 hypothetical protein AQJ84_39295 [Streptomyces resistomycificus]
MGSLLKGVSGVRWGELRDARQLPAGDIPPLLSRIAYGGEDTARLGIDELGDLVCALGFVVGEATASTVPFLLELAGAPQVPCKAELLELLESIYRTEQWHSSAAAAGVPKRTSFHEQPPWEIACRVAVRAGRPIIEGLASSVRPEETEPARKLLRTMDEVPPFPKI